MKHSLTLKNLEGCTLNELEMKIAHQQVDNHNVVFTLAMEGGGTISPKNCYPAADSYTI